MQLKFSFLIFSLFLGGVPLCAQNEAKTLLVKPIADSPSLTKWALVIGVDDYENPNVSKLNVCGKDAQSFASYLQTEMKFPAAAIRVMTDATTDPQKKPTYTRLKGAIRTFLAGIGPESEVVFFFSGHGARTANQDWLLPLDGDPEDLIGTGISYTSLRSELEGKQPHRCLMVTDACRNLLEGKAAGGSGFGADEMLKSPQFAELRSCRPKEISREMPDGSGSVFTHYLLEGLKGALEAQNVGGTVTFDSLQFFVRANVRQYVANRFASAQNPDGLANFGGMVLARPPDTISEKTIPVKIRPWQVPEGKGKGDTMINPIDGAEMVWIPEGDFTMGLKDFLPNPLRQVNVDGFWMYKTEVTVAQYRKFCNAKRGGQMPQAPKWSWQDNYPMVNVSWDDASAYCEWAGVRLPSEQEWEKAARGEDGREYPWGNEFDANKAVFHTEQPAPVGSKPGGMSPYGCLDMAGSVWEWCEDKWRNDIYTRAMRGGAFGGDFPLPLRAYYQVGSALNSTSSVVGFRCAVSP